MSARLKITPTTRTLAKLRADGWLADVVERRQGRISIDCFDSYDVLGLGSYSDNRYRFTQAILVQCTSDNGGNFAARLKKCRDNPLTAQLLARGVRCEVWGWRDDKPDPRIEVLT
jgi:hypothetical protein